MNGRLSGRGVSEADDSGGRDGRAWATRSQQDGLRRGSCSCEADWAGRSQWLFLLVGVAATTDYTGVGLL